MTQRATARNEASTIRRGFVATLPLWISVIPIGVAYSLVAREAGWSPLAIQLMSLAVFSSATQLSAIAALEHGESLPLIALLSLSLNAQLLLFGLTVGRRLRPTGARRLLAASLLTDGTFAVAASLAPFSLGALIGAGASMYVAWNLGTALGLLGGASVSGLATGGVAIVGPLIYAVVLVPLLRRRVDLLVAAVAALIALAVSRAAPAGLAVLAAALVAVLIGARSGPGADARRIARERR